MSEEPTLNQPTDFHKTNGINLRATQKHPFRVPDEPEEERFVDEYGKLIRSIPRLSELSGSRQLPSGRRSLHSL